MSAKTKSLKVFKAAAGIVLSAAVATASFVFPASQYVSAASAETGGGLVGWNQNFDNKDGITPNGVITDKTQQWIATNGISATIQNYAVSLSGIDAPADETKPPVYLRPIGESTLNQRVSADFLSLDVAEQRIYLRATQASISNANNFYAYYASANDGMIQIGKIEYDGSQRKLSSINSDMFDYEEGKRYRMVFTAEGRCPTVLCATLYDLSDLSVVATLTENDNSSSLQASGTAGIGAEAYTDGDAALFDNFNYSQFNDTLVKYDNFNRENGDAGEEWIIADDGIKISGNKLAMNDTAATAAGKAADSLYPLALRPQSEKALNQSVSIRLDSIIDGGAQWNVQPVLFLRVNGNDSAAATEIGRTLKCAYVASFNYKCYNGRSRIIIGKITENGYEELQSVQPANGEKDWINQKKTGRMLYFNFTATQIDENTTKLTVGVSRQCVTTNPDNYNNTVYSNSVTDSTISLQQPGTAGISYRSIEDEWNSKLGTAANTADRVLKVSEFIYLSNDKAVEDINGDEELNATDLADMRKVLLGVGSENVDGDVNGDFKTNILDLIRLKKQLDTSYAERVQAVSDYTGTFETKSGGADAAAVSLAASVEDAADNLKITGTKYYFSNNGNDANDGKTPATAFATLDKLKAISGNLKAGDAVLFERGSVFRQGENKYDAFEENAAVNTVSGISYGAYGTGAKPEFLGSSRNYANDSSWTECFDNVWKLNLPLQDVGVIVFNGGAAAGAKKSELAALEKTGDFYHNEGTGELYLYCSVAKPSAAFDDIEIGVRRMIFLFNSGVSNVTLDNLSVKYSGSHAIQGAMNNNGITITNCDISWAGGSYYADKKVRYGNGIQFWSTCSDVSVENCRISQIFDAGFTFQGDASAEFKNITFKGNLIQYCMYSIEMYAQDDAVLSNINISDNVMQFAGYGFTSISQRTDISHICGWNGNYGSNATNISIKNNKFDLSRYNLINWTFTDNIGISVSGNSFYQSATNSGNAVNYGDFGQLTATNAEELRTAVSNFDSSPAAVGWITK